MLYTRFVIGEETLSSTSAFNFCHCAIFSNAINSFILGPVVEHYRKQRHKDIPSHAERTSSEEDFGRMHRESVDGLPIRAIAMDGAPWKPPRCSWTRARTSIQPTI